MDKNDCFSEESIFIFLTLEIYQMVNQMKSLKLLMVESQYFSIRIKNVLVSRNIN